MLFLFAFLGGRGDDDGGVVDCRKYNNLFDARENDDFFIDFRS